MKLRAFLAVSGTTQERGSKAVLKLHAFLSVSGNTPKRGSTAVLKLHAFLAVSWNTQQRGSKAVLKLHAFLGMSGNTQQHGSKAVVNLHAFLTVSWNTQQRGSKAVHWKSHIFACERADRQTCKQSDSKSSQEIAPNAKETHDARPFFSQPHLKTYGLTGMAAAAAGSTDASLVQPHY